MAVLVEGISVIVRRDATERKLKGFSITRDSSKDYDFDVHPDALDDESVQEFEVEVLRGGWKIENRVIIKPKVFEVRK